MNILVVDDSKTMRVIIAKMLKELGNNIYEAGNGKEAIDFLKTNNVDLIMADWNMPEMNGYDMLIAIKSDERTKNIPVIMVTTESEVSNVQKAIDSGANGFITKPFKKETIQSKLQELTGAKNG